MLRRDASQSAPLVLAQAAETKPTVLAVVHPRVDMATKGGTTKAGTVEVVVTIEE